MQHANARPTSRTARVITGVATAIAGLGAIATSFTVVEESPASQQMRVQLRAAQQPPLMLTAVMPPTDLEDLADQPTDMLVPPPMLALLIPQIAPRSVEFDV